MLELFDEVDGDELSIGAVGSNGRGAAVEEFDGLLNASTNCQDQELRSGGRDEDPLVLVGEVPTVDEPRH